jgi:hypothetical protein
MQFNNESDKCTNNIAEYEAILLGLRKLRAIGVKNASSALIPKWSPNKEKRCALLENPSSRDIWALSEKWRIILKDS